MKKLFIFEGPDGCGKSTQVELFSQKLTALGKKVKVTREPGGTPLGEEIRNILLDSEYDLSLETQAYLFAAARRAHNEQIVEWINEGYTVICDRHILSSLAYQSANAGDTPRRKMESIHDITKLNSIAMMPIEEYFRGNPYTMSEIKDAQIIYFKISPETMVKRAKERLVCERGLDNIEKRYVNTRDSKELIERYDMAVEKLNDMDIITIDANRTVEEIHQDIINLL